MSKETSRDVRDRKAALRRAQKTRKADDQKKKRRRGMIEVTYQCSCGCCTGTAHFKSKERAAQVFNDIMAEARRTNNVSMLNEGSFTDDAGEKHTDVDIFYGFSINPKEFDKPPLERLAKKTGLI